MGGRADAAGRIFPPVERPRVPLPERFTVEASSGRGLRVHWRWFRPAILLLIPFALFWNGFVVFWMAMAPAPMRFFALIHVAVGLGLMGAVVLGLVNRTTVTLAGGSLEVAHGPLPWFGGGTWRTGDLEQLYVVRRESRSKNGTTVTWDLTALTKAGRKQVLVRGLHEVDQALWLEREIEVRLGIVDRRVGGEAPHG